MNSDENDGDRCASLIPCPDCGNSVPTTNLELHRLRACPSNGDVIGNNGPRYRGTTLPVANLATTTNIYATIGRSTMGAEDDAFAIATTTAADSPSRRPRKTRRGNSSTAEDVIMQSSSSSSSSSSSDNNGVIDLMHEYEQIASSISTVNARTVDLTTSVNGDDDEEEDRKLPARSTNTSGTINTIENDEVVNLMDEPEISSDALGGVDPSSVATASARTVDLTTSGNGDDDDEEDRKMPARDGSTDINPSNNHHHEKDDEWSCPRCTLRNKNTSSRCDACQYINVDIRRRLDRNASTVHRNQSSSREQLPFTDSSPLGLISSGALLGAAVGMAGNWMQGRNTLRGAVEGGTTGAMGGALLHEVLNSNNRDHHRGTSMTQTGFAARERHNHNDADISSNYGNSAYAQPSVTIGEDGYPNVDSRVTNMYQSTTTTRVSISRSSNNQDNDALRGDDAYADPFTNRASAQDRDIRMRQLLARLQRLPDTPIDHRRALYEGHRSNIDGLSYDQLLSAFGNGTENMGAKQSEIRRLPTHVVGDKPLPEDARQCLICLEDFEMGDSRTILPCLHAFHKNCCRKWLSTNGKCPICKHPISSNA